MRTAYGRLLNEVCVRLGFCGSVGDGQPSHVDDFIPENGSVTADAFAAALFRAEGWDPKGPAAQEFRSAICEAFARHMGSSEVDASRLR